jgi:glutamate/tyrosine decarboxylase-like PLP-dependent enzyme
MIKVRFEREIHIYRAVREMGVEGIRKMVQQTFRKRP